MKTLKINVPEGYEIDKEQSTFENIVFKEVKKELPKSWEDLENLKGFHVGYTSDIVMTSDHVRKSKINRFIFATEEQAEASIALAQLSQLREVYRQGWVPDWENGSITKYTISRFRNDLIIMDTFVAEHFLSFQSRKIAEQFFENFRELIEKAKPLMS
jgi:hypothetical protein